MKNVLHFASTNFDSETFARHGQLSRGGKNTYLHFAAVFQNTNTRKVKLSIFSFAAVFQNTNTRKVKLSIFSFSFVRWGVGH
jgi:hypothetical protein